MNKIDRRSALRKKEKKGKKKKKERGRVFDAGIAGAILSAIRPCAL